jgi:hypothetical protein
LTYTGVVFFFKCAKQKKKYISKEKFSLKVMMLKYKVREFWSHWTEFISPSYGHIMVSTLNCEV